MRWHSVSASLALGGLANWVVFVDENADGIRSEKEQFTYTDENGNYSFTLAHRNRYPGSERGNCRDTQKRRPSGYRN